MSEESTKACLGAETKTVWNASGDMEECVCCGTRVRWDLVDHPFFGFKHQGCKHKEEDAEEK
ncbi:unnamed protein product [marine sediment metagenome]|uniref:Uncharacterized protein n=1 Tax=marine sediment metagenome TaxID=412755 RepID=X0UJU4_9ZZZZ